MADQAVATPPPTGEELRNYEGDLRDEVAGFLEARAELLGDTESEWRDQFVAIAKALRHCEGRADVYPPTREEERAITIAYTALWQYREATTDTYGNTHEPPALFAARLDLRRRLDIIDAETTVDLTREERNLLAGLIGNRMWFWGDALMYSKRQLKKGQRKAADRVARVTRLSEVIGWKTHVKRKKARGRVWTVPFGILLPAIDALLDEFRDELADMARMADREKEAGKSLEESSLRRDIALKNGYLGRLLDLRTKAEEAVEGGRP